jgi:parvulin-like peptidyl-prolyl isomerase
MLANVRHLLVSFEGGKLNSDGSRTYTDAEKATAKGKAEALLKQWKEGEKADEAAFIELVKKNSTDEGTAPDGGLIEDIHKNSSLDANFRSWAIDPERKASDTGVIESVYGYHVMYYVGDGDINYRDYMITDDMRAEDMEKWHEEVLKTVTVTEQDTHRLKLDLVMSAL